MGVDPNKAKQVGVAELLTLTRRYSHDPCLFFDSDASAIVSLRSRTTIAGNQRPEPPAKQRGSATREHPGLHRASCGWTKVWPCASKTVSSSQLYYIFLGPTGSWGLSGRRLSPHCAFPGRALVSPKGGEIRPPHNRYIWQNIRAGVIGAIG